MFGNDLMVMQTSSNNTKYERLTGDRYASTEEELYTKAIRLLDKCKVEERR